jgi:hypothetical protein
MSAFAASPDSAAETRTWSGSVLAGFASEADAARARELDGVVRTFLERDLHGAVRAPEPDAQGIVIGRIHVALSKLGWVFAQSVIGLAVSLVFASPTTGVMAGVNLLVAIGSHAHLLSAEQARLVAWVCDRQRLGEPRTAADAPSDPAELIREGVLETDATGQLHVVF